VRASIPSNRLPVFSTLFLLIYLLCAGSSAEAANLRASLDRNTTSVGESVTLSLVIEDASLRSQPQLPPIQGVQMGGVSASQSFSMINGKTTQSTTYDYALIPTQVGDITIPALSVAVGNQTLTTQPLKLKVTQRPVATATAPDGTPQEAFLKLVVPKNEMFLGEIMPVELKLYFQAVRDAHLPQVSAAGFTMSQLPQQPEQTRTQIDGRVYNVVTFRFSVSPTRTGNLTLGPATQNIVILSNPRQGFFGMEYSTARQAAVSSDSANINVLSLPAANKPATFNGAIGQYRMTLDAGPTSVGVGDPITVKVQVSGRGSLESLKLPDQPSWREFKMYPPNSKIETTDPLGLEGEKVFELVVAPQNAGITALPPLEFSFFDPEQKSYQTLRSQPVALSVRPTAATPQPTVISAQSQADEEQASKEIVHIKPQLGTLLVKEAPLITRPGFWIVPAIGPLFWIGTIIYRRQRDQLANNPRLRRQKETDRIVREGLEKMKEQAAANKSEDFFATLFHVLQEQIGERLDVPASSITEAVVEEELKPRGLNASAATLLHGLFQSCNQARYAPVRGSQELASFIPKTEEALNELRKLNSRKLAVTV
jgi:hypothetical protein